MGCQWRYLPSEFPHWDTVYGVFRGWRMDGTWLAIHNRLREMVRTTAGKKPIPAAAIIDSQSVRTAEGGVDLTVGKDHRPQKRQIAVDALGLLLSMSPT
jgi:putative transposase